MADYAGDVATLDMSTQRLTLAKETTWRTAVPTAPQLRVLHDVSPDGGAHESTGEGFATTPKDLVGTPITDPGLMSWFERVWAFPLRIDLGNILTTVTSQLEVYNAYREEARNLTVATNNAGAGISFDGIPSLPHTVTAQEGLLFDVVVTTSGPPEIDGTLDFTLDSGSLSVPITGTRVVMFPYEPETPIKEVLEFATDIRSGVNSSEQRASIRKHPRQIFDMRFRTLEDNERQKLNNLLFAWQAGVFGVPIWFEARLLSQDAAVSATTIYCDTSYADFRVGSLLIVWEDSETFDAVEIDTVNSDNIVLSSPLVNGYSAGEALVMPLRVAYTETDVRGQQWLNALDEVALTFRVIDNEADIGDTSAWSSHNGKVLMDDPNWVSGQTIQQDLLRQIKRFDNKTAAIQQLSEWAVSRYATKKGWVCNSLQETWQVRQLLHALRGSHATFYLPTFRNDITPSQNLAAGSFNMDIEHCDYTTWVNAQDPNASVMIELVDGTRIAREVLSASELSDTEERLVVDVAWASTIDVADISRVSFLRLCRIANDRVTFAHSRPGSSKARANLVGVTR